jgi:two-component system chemotaxis sensor kinase CheA
LPFGELLARQHGRQVALTTSGDDISLDVSMVDRLKTPIRLLLSFSVADSIGSAEQRIAAGKSGLGHVRIALARHDDHVTVTIEDDGDGIDLAVVAERARQKGWEGEAASADMVLREGFGRIGRSGTGGGTDFGAILATLRPHGGALQVANLGSGGTRFQLTMPLAMVVLDGMVVRVGEIMYVVPIDAIQQIVHSSLESLMRVSANRGQFMLRLDQGDVLPVHFPMRSGHADDGDGAEFILPDAPHGQERQQKRLFVIAGKGSERVALSVDELVGQQLVLIRPLQGYLSAIRGVTGCALLGSGGIGMVLDMGAVLNQA